MVFKPNYNFQKAERDRAKAAKKEQKARDKEEAKRRAEAGEPPLDAEGAEAADSGIPSDSPAKPGEAA